MPDECLPHVTVVSLPACHFCHEAEQTLAALGRAGSVTVTVLDADSPQGRALVAAHRPPLAPLVLVDGEYFSAGRLPKHKLARALGERRLAGAGA